MHRTFKCGSGTICNTVMCTTDYDYHLIESRKKGKHNSTKTRTVTNPKAKIT